MDDEIEAGRGEHPQIVHRGLDDLEIEPPLGRFLTQVRHYERPIAKNPGTTFVLGHSGALQMDVAIELSRQYPNVYLEISSQSLSNVRRLLREVAHDRLLFGSDWPFYHQAMPLAKLLIASEGDDALRRKVQYENAARLLGLPARA
jgi:predicted TIM-barrel fold metal-dependent hydrolase